jgi:Allene oxide cyclase barrel like domain
MQNTAEKSTAIVIENIKEICHTTVRHGGNAPIDESISINVNFGASVNFTDELYDEDGNQIGTSEGLSVVFADADGTMMQVVSAADRFPDGTVVWTGTYPMFPINEPRSVAAYGISGRYDGKKGTRGFQLLERPDAGTSIIKANLVLDD